MNWFTLVLITLCSLQVFAKEDNNQLLATEWKKTSFSEQSMVDAMTTTRPCQESDLNMVYCIKLVNGIASVADPELKLVPKEQYAAQPLLNQKYKAVQEYGPLVLIESLKSKVPLVEPKSTSQEKIAAEKAKGERLLAAAVALRSQEPKVDLVTLAKELLAKRDAAMPVQLAVGAGLNEAESVFDAHYLLLPVALMEKAMNPKTENFDGIGVRINGGNDKIVIESIVDGGPSEKSGLRKLDEIVSVNDEIVEGKPIDEAINIIRGPRGTRANLKVRRKGELLPIAVTRGPVESKVFTSRVVNHMGERYAHFRLNQFSGGSDKMIYDELLKLEADKNPETRVKGIILDVRDNPGGLLQAAVNIGGMFAGRKTITRTLSLGGMLFEEEDSHMDAVTQLPLVFLINQRSASASELLPNGLRDHKVGLIVGIRSYGKGSVQRVEPVPQLAPVYYEKKTIATFYPPVSERTNQLVGVDPDIEAAVVPNPGEDELFFLRESENAPAAVPVANHVPWVQNRPELVAKIKDCLAANHRAEDLFAADDNVDYQLLKGEEVLKCQAQPVEKAASLN